MKNVFSDIVIVFDHGANAFTGNDNKETKKHIQNHLYLEKKIGGVRETLSLWPFPKNRVNINPDVYVKESAAVSRESIGIEQPTTNRPVLFLVCCDLDKNEKLNASLMEQLDNAASPPAVVDANESQVIVGYKTLFSAMEFCDLATKTMAKPFQQQSTLRLSLHVGPLTINANTIRQKLSGDGVDTLQKLHTITLAGSVYATSMLAAILALDTKKYSFDYVDAIHSTENGANLEVFSVHVNKVPA